jgi:hypothetical protein
MVPSSRAYFAGEQHAFVRRALSACMPSLLQPVKSLPKDLCRSDMRRHDDPIVHPLPLPSPRDDTSTAEVSKVPRDLRLRATQDLNKIANTNLFVANEIQYPEPSVIPESLKEPFHVEGLLRCHISMYTPWRMRKQDI